MDSEFVEGESYYIVFDGSMVTIFTFHEPDMWMMVEYTFNRYWELR